jgi:hypothetical protein
MALVVLMAMITAVVGAALVAWAKKKEATIGYGPLLLALAAHGIVLFARVGKMDWVFLLMAIMIGFGLLLLAGLWAFIRVWRARD